MSVAHGMIRRHGEATVCSRGLTLAACRLCPCRMRERKNAGLAAVMGAWPEPVKMSVLAMVKAAEREAKRI